ncbi:glycosyltransferase [Cellulophaga sp. 20_2_10]|uniref:glycosyltransferase n=1 Tax=Cellulophaga sp. 20_2_10 TaxID=2942476 RepID=UPI00201A240D|nr:glycosyltransferase [Cellulophaga sp. 20_2_10]MCL5246183.1 glycosyltransferase [Cellulophaga sp. 20_2_10]
MDFLFSFIVPVYNRPNEIGELLESLEKQTYTKPYEIVIVEDGSTISSEEEVARFSTLPISYYKKENSGPGDSRNYGMRKAKGNYFIVLDSDCILPPQYLATAEASLQAEYVDCYGGPDAAHESFSTVQKAINYAMTSFLTTGGIRGGKKAVDKFQPRSFNMGISKVAFEKTGGYGNIHPGEDPDLTIRIWNNGFKTKLIPEAYVYHKRRIDWNKFYIQVNKFGMVRPILNKWHPETAKVTYWFPALFCFGFLVSLVAYFIGLPWFLFCYNLYFTILFVDSLIKNKSIIIAFLSIVAVVIQFVGYGYGFVKSTLVLSSSKKKAQELFPKLFFKL